MLDIKTRKRKKVSLSAYFQEKNASLTKWLMKNWDVYKRQVKELFKLLQKKHRDKTGMFLVFGEHGILEAEKTNNIVEIYTVNNSKKGVLIDKKIIKELAPLSSPTERVAIVKKPSVKPYSDKVLIIDGIQDPGNLGTLIRSAVGFGFSSIIASEDTVDFYNDKVVSAAQGNLFYANLIRKDLVEEIKELKKKGYKIIGTDVDKGKKICLLYTS